MATSRAAYNASVQGHLADIQGGMYKHVPRDPGLMSSHNVGMVGADGFPIFGNNTGMYMGDAHTMAPCLAGLVDNFTCNYTLSPTDMGEDDVAIPRPLPLWQMIILGGLAALTCITTITGNLIVIMSFVLERTIRQPTNYYIASLAVSDLLIGSLSMPFYTVYLLMGEYWPLGWVLCDLWLSVDYTVCLTSIYTVFCITIDRFCSVKIPAKYRGWRTERKVLNIIACTWIIPIVVFFTSIFGWQYFVGKRTVKPGMCYVQYMEDPVFNCVLQVGYFWTTLIVMCTLYTGIYKVALDLQRKSEAKHKKMTSLVSMAGQTMTKIGIGMSQQQSIDTKKLFSSKGDGGPKPKGTAGGASVSGASATTSTPKTDNQQNTKSTTSFNTNKKPAKETKDSKDKEEDRSSSPAFPSDTDPSSQSPKRGSPKPKRSKSKGEKRSKRPKPLKLPQNSVGGRKKSTSNTHSNRLSPPGPVPTGTNSIPLALPPPPSYKAIMDKHQQSAQDTISPVKENHVVPGSTSCSTQCVVGDVDVPVIPLQTSPLLTSKNAVTGLSDDLPNHSTSLVDITEDTLNASSHSICDIMTKATLDNAANTCDLSVHNPAIIDITPRKPSIIDVPVHYPSIIDVTTRTPSLHDITTNVKLPQQDCVPRTNGIVPMESNGLVAAGGVYIGDTGGVYLGEVNTIFKDDVISGGAVHNNNAAFDISAPPELISGVRYIDQDSLKSLQSAENIRLLAEKLIKSPSIKEEPDSPIWKKRSSFLENDNNDTNDKPWTPPAPCCQKSSIEASGGCSPLRQDSLPTPGVPPPTPLTPPPGTVEVLASSLPASPGLSPATMHVETETSTRDSIRTVTRLSKPEEIQSIDGASVSGVDSRQSSKRDRPHKGSPFRNIVKSINSKKGRKKSRKEKQKSKSENRARKALRVITIILGAFVVCWTPWHILSMIMGFCPEDKVCVQAILYNISYWLCYLNSPLNPLCYAFANQQFKKTFIRILKLDWHRT